MLACKTISAGAVSQRMTQRDTELLQALFARLAQAGFDETNVARWFAVPALTDARFAVPPVTRTRRGLGAWIALWVAGEVVPVEALRPQPTAAERAALVATGLAADADERLRPLVRAWPWRGMAIVSPPGEELDVSALN